MAVAVAKGKLCRQSAAMPAFAWWEDVRPASAVTVLLHNNYSMLLLLDWYCLKADFVKMLCSLHPGRQPEQGSGQCGELMLLPAFALCTLELVCHRNAAHCQALQH